jgi:hypothetical protein
MIYLLSAVNELVPPLFGEVLFGEEILDAILVFGSFVFVFLRNALHFPFLELHQSR